MSETITEWTFSREQIGDVQSRKLRRLIEEVGIRNPFWKKRFEDRGILASSISSIDDLEQIGFLTKHEIVADATQHSLYGSNLTYPLSEYSRFHQTSGTTGRPLVWMDTRQSWSWFMECWKLIYHAAGVTSEDRFCFPFSFGPFIGFWAGFEGATQFGNLVIPAGGLTTTARLRLILDHQVSVVCCTPTYALRMAEVAITEGIDIASSHVRLVIVAGEPGGSVPSIRARIEQAWQARVIDHWGMTEIGSLGVEAADDPGNVTILETQCIPEIIHPATLQPVSQGEVGELVITNLGRWGNPLLRYRTGDLVKGTYSQGPSGCNFLRLEGGVLGRVDDMVTIRGNNVYPSSVEAVLREFPDVIEYRMTVEPQRGMKQMRIELEFSAEIDESRKKGLTKNLFATIKDRLNFQPELEVVEAHSLPRFEMKGRRLVRKDL